MTTPPWRAVDPYYHGYDCEACNQKTRFIDVDVYVHNQGCYNLTRCPKCHSINMKYYFSSFHSNCLSVIIEEI